MRFDDATGDREAKADAATVARTSLPEALEQSPDLLLRETGPSVRDMELSVAIRSRDAQRHAPAGRRELEGVAEQVAEDLRGAVLVGAKREVLCRRADLELDFLVGGHLAKRFFGLAQQTARFHVLELQREAPGLKTRRVQQIADQTIHLSNGALRHLKQIGALVFLELGIGKELGG